MEERVQVSSGSERDEESEQVALSHVVYEADCWRQKLAPSGDLKQVTFTALEKCG